LNCIISVIFIKAKYLQSSSGSGFTVFPKGKKSWLGRLIGKEYCPGCRYTSDLGKKEENEPVVPLCSIPRVDKAMYLYMLI
jgi:hypothetical protein